jgi:cysteine synthase A
LAKAHGWWQPCQFQNPANADIHARTTAVEILEDFADMPLDYWVTGFGTGGTLNGVSRVLKVKSPQTKIIICEPDNSQLLASGIAQPRNSDGSHSQSHPNFRPHLMQGWSPDFIPQLAAQAVDAAHIDGYVPINGNDALQCAKNLAQYEGIFVGITAGATFAGALHIAAQAAQGATILCMLPDTGERYLSTPLFDDVAVEMTEAELEISRSTPHYRFDQPSATVPASTENASTLDEAAVKEIDLLLSDDSNPVVMFALEWCEFCWSVRKMLAKYEIAFRSVDLDSVTYQDNNRGGKIREALKDRTTWNTFPQIFIGGKFIGGCTDLFDQCKDGRLATLLNSQQIPYNKSVTTDPYTLLPTWLHPR